MLMVRLNKTLKWDAENMELARNASLEISYLSKMEGNLKDGRQRSNIKVGLFVEIVQKQHQRSGELTEGVVKRLLTKSPNHPHGIKVQLETGEVGRVKNILEE